MRLSRDSSRPSVLPVFSFERRLGLHGSSSGGNARYLCRVCRSASSEIFRPGRSSNARPGRILCCLASLGSSRSSLRGTRKRRVEEPKFTHGPGSPLLQTCLAAVSDARLPRTHTTPPLSVIRHNPGKGCCCCSVCCERIPQTVPCCEAGAPSHLRDRGPRTLPTSCRCSRRELSGRDSS